MPPESFTSGIVDRLLEAARQVPGVTSAGVTTVLPSTMTCSDRRLVLRMTLNQGAIVILVGVAIGLPATILLGRVIESALLGLLATDVLLVGGVTAVLALVALLATVIPARRATRLNPALVIRE